MIFDLWITYTIIGIFVLVVLILFFLTMAYIN